MRFTGEKAEKDKRHMCKQVQQCATAAVKQVCVCYGILTKDPFCLKQGEWGGGASQARPHRGGDTDLRWCNKACRKEGKARIKVQGHESNDIFREFQVI